MLVICICLLWRPKILRLLTNIEEHSKYGGERKCLVPLIELELMETSSRFPTIIFLENSTPAKTNALPSALQRSFQRIRLWAPPILNSILLSANFQREVFPTNITNQHCRNISSWPWQIFQCCIFHVDISMLCGSVRSLSLKWKQSCLYNPQLIHISVNCISQILEVHFLDLSIICFHWTSLILACFFWEDCFQFQ